jgi:hypothetical protein
MVFQRPDDTPAIIRVTPPEERLRLHYRPTLLRQGGVGGWVERPHDRAKSTAEWMGTPSHHWTLSLFFDRDALYSRPNVGGDIEGVLEQLHRFGQPTASTGEPPVLRLNFGHGQQLRLVITDILYRSTELDPRTKRRVQAAVDVDLLEHRQAALALSPVEAVEATATAGATPATPADSTAGARTYTVTAGDTDGLSGIAARELGDPAKWIWIYRLNSPPLTSPDLIQVGQVLTMPPA